MLHNIFSSLGSIIPGGILTVAIVLAVILLVRLITKPIKWGIKLLINGAIGFVLLFLVNFIGSYIGLYVPVTWITCLVSGFFGIPGVIGIIAFMIFF